MALLELTLDSGTELTVSRFYVREAVSELFDIWIQAASTQPDISSEGIVDQPMGFYLDWQRDRAKVEQPRIWTGRCSHFQQLQAEPSGLSTYLLRLVPDLWRLGQRVNHRIFKDRGLRDIVTALMREWNLEGAAWNATVGATSREYTVQYGESDYAFLCRLVESAGVAFVHQENPAVDWPCTEERSVLVFSDALEKRTARLEPVPFVDNPSMAGGQDYVAQVRLADEVGPTRYVVTDYAFQKPDFALKAEASTSTAPGRDDQYERYHHEHGALHEGRGDLLHTDKTIDVERRLAAARAGAREVTFDTNATELAPGTIFTVGNHPLLDETQRLLVTSLTLEGAANEDWHLAGTAVFASEPFVPPRITPKPSIQGVQTAKVLQERDGTDEHGRICIQFPWDRDKTPSCWIRVSQGAASGGFGIYTWPQPGDEVVVSYIDGDPDQPIVVGRLYNATQLHPYKLPDHRTRSTWRGAQGNELTLEDQEGSEFVYSRAAKDQLTEVVGERHTTVGKNRFESVGANRNLTVTGNDMTSVSGGTSLTVGTDHQIKAGGKHAVDAAQEVHLKSGMKVVIEAGAELTLKAPGGFIKVDAAGVTIKGNIVQVNCPGPPPGSGSGAAPAAAKPPTIDFDGKPD